MAASDPRERLNTVLLYASIFLLVYLSYRIFEPFLIPLGWAGVLVVVFYPLHERLERRWGAGRAAAVSALGVTLILIVPALALATLVVREGMEAARAIQRAVGEGNIPVLNHAWEWVAARLPGNAADLPTLVREGAARLGEFLAGSVGAVLRNVAVFLFDLFVTLFALFYFFRDAGKILAMLRRLLPFEEGHRERIFSESRELIFASVTTSLVIAAVHGLAGGIAFALVGIASPIFWGVTMAFCSLVPVVGSGLIWIPAALWLVFSGHWGRALALAAICAAIAGSADNVLRPMLLAGRARLSGLTIFIGVLGGVAAFGMLGLVLGPIILATAAGVLDVYSRREVAPRAT